MSDEQSRPKFGWRAKTLSPPCCSILCVPPRPWKPARAVPRQLFRAGVESTALKSTVER